MYLIPEPQRVRKEGEGFAIGYDTVIRIAGDCGENAFYCAGLLNEDLERWVGYGLTITKGREERNSILLCRDETLSEEEYRLQVSGEGIRVTGGGDGGLLYGTQTLRQILRQEGARIQGLVIEDFPHIKNRGFYYDIARGRVPTLTYLKKLADRLAYYKVNQMQLYIEHSFMFEGFSQVWRDDTPMTPVEILELDAYCKRLHIELVPSLSCFGHLHKILSSSDYANLCELTGEEEQLFSFYNRMHHHTVDVSNPKSLVFVKKMIEEYLPLFTSEQFNICADETFDLGRGRSKELAEEKGVSRIYVDFIKELCGFLKEHGRRVMFWGDVICGFPEFIKELPEGTICLNWGYDADEKEEPARRLHEAGAIQYCCPGVCGWNQLVNKLETSYLNIRRMCEYGDKYDACGILNTDWGDNGHINPPDMSIPGMIYGAAFSWNQGTADFQELNRQISRVEYTDQSELLVSVMDRISQNALFDWQFMVRWKEGDAKVKEEFIGRAKLAQVTDADQQLEGAKEELYSILVNMDSAFRGRIKPYLLAVEGIRIMNGIGAILGSRYHDRKDTVPPEPVLTARRLEAWFQEYKELWRSTSKESELFRLQETINWYGDLLRKAQDS